MKPLSLLVKPASGNCTLRCKYCFYHPPVAMPAGVMSLYTLEQLIKKAMAEAGGTCNIAFQGGEPMLAGLAFYRRAVELVKQNNTRNIAVSFSLQTNGMAMDDEWAAFLRENSFLVGLSVDGTRELHDALRQTSSGGGTWKYALQAAAVMDKHAVQYNILCVVTAATTRHAALVYSGLKAKGFRWLQFIPCIDPPGERADYSLTAERYGRFLKELFDLWYADMRSGERVSIRYFDNLVAMLAGQLPEACGMAGQCFGYFTVEADGSVFPCDFYVSNEWLLGNINESNFEQLRVSQPMRRFAQSSKHVDPNCLVCRWQPLCRGGCRRDREPFIDGHPALNRLCFGYQAFFEYAYERLEQLAGFYEQGLYP